MTPARTQALMAASRENHFFTFLAALGVLSLRPGSAGPGQLRKAGWTLAAARSEPDLQVTGPASKGVADTSWWSTPAGTRGR